MYITNHFILFYILFLFIFIIYFIFILFITKLVYDWPKDVTEIDFNIISGNQSLFATL